MTVDEKIVVLLRRCGHHLHHNVKSDSAVNDLVSFLSESEKEEFIHLLENCLHHWTEK